MMASRKQCCKLFKTQFPLSHNVGTDSSNSNMGGLMDLWPLNFKKHTQTNRLWKHQKHKPKCTTTTKTEQKQANDLDDVIFWAVHSLHTYMLKLLLPAIVRLSSQPSTVVVLLLGDLWTSNNNQLAPLPSSSAYFIYLFYCAFSF